MIRALFLALGLATPSSADPAETVAQMRAQAGATAAGLAYWDGALTLAVDGLRHRGGAAVTPQDPWHIGSNTKSMTAVIAARLVTKGAIAWDSTLAEVLPDQAMAAEHRKTTLAQLLRHQSYLPANPPRRFLRDPDAHRDAYVDLVLTLPQVDAPVYSNAGYVVAARMLEAATVQTWESLLQEHVAAPLGLKSLGLGAPPDPAPHGHRVVLGRTWAVPPGPNADNPAAMAPAGGVHLSLSDMIRYLRAHLDRDPEFLPEAQWDMLHGATDTPMGWVARDGLLFHTGSNTFWYQAMILDPANGRAFVASTNAGTLRRSDAAMARAWQSLTD